MSHKKGSFKLRRKYFLIVFLLSTTALILTAFYVSAVDTYFSNHYPAKNSTITLSNPKISAYVKSLSELDSARVKLKLNGTEVSPIFLYKGKWVTDYYGNRSYVISDRREGTISYDTANLKDGINTVDVSIYDKASPPNLLSDSWSFTVAEPPKFETISPADKSEQVTLNQLSAFVSDNNAVNWDTVKLKLNNAYVDSGKLIVNRDTGMITYNYNFPSNTYTAFLEAKDSNGILGTRTWTFTVDSSAPDLVSLYDFKDGSVITDGILKFRGDLKDLVDIKNNVTLSLDGIPLNINFRYKGTTDYYGNYNITSYKQAYINFEGTVPNGNHKLSLYTEDKLGNKITRSWSFIMSAKPVISNETPIKYGVDNLKPTISAVVKSPNGSVKADSITLELDGKAADFKFDGGTGEVTYTPSETLKNESYHTVKLTVSDLTGLSVSRDWKFYTNNYPDMKDSGASNCTTCHPVSSFAGSNGVLEDIHSKKLSFGGTHSKNRCENCHNYITVPAGCSQCHGDPNADWVGYAPHGSTPTIHYQPKNMDPYFPIRITENREQYDCIVCHQPGSQVKGYEGYLSTPTRILNNHDIPELHKTSDESCTKCHAQSLTHEHARDERTDKDGNPITCHTCHQSTDTKVIQAIKDKNLSCSACHGEASHDELHVNTEMSDNCTGCHSNTLTTEHKNRNIKCAGCHDSQDPIVVKAIANKDKTCQACHTKPIHEAQHAECKNCHKSNSVPTQ
jgi:hypothetical protein